MFRDVFGTRLFSHWMIEKWLDVCFEVSLKRQGRDVGHRNSVVAELIGPFPNPMSCRYRVGSRNEKIFLRRRHQQISGDFQGVFKGQSQVLKSNRIWIAVSSWFRFFLTAVMMNSRKCTFGSQKTDGVAVFLGVFCWYRQPGELSIAQLLESEEVWALEKGCIIQLTKVVSRRWDILRSLTSRWFVFFGVINLE